jgi:hypothetical protein
MGSQRDNDISPGKGREDPPGPPEPDRRNLWGLIRAHFGVSLGYRRFTPGHSTPLDFVQQALEHPAVDLAAWACRSGGKTLAASILAALEFAGSRDLQVRVLSGSQQQARSLYDYWTRWCHGPLAELIDHPPGSTGTTVHGGRLEILPASQRAVRGPKVQRLYEDEVDEIAPEVDAAAAGMIDSRPALPGRTVYTSTWHRTDATMARLVDRAAKGGLDLHRWNIWEAVARCPAQRHRDGAGCSQCPLAEPCVEQARLHHQQPDRQVGIASEAVGLFDVADLIKIYGKVGQGCWDAEFLCRRPTPEGLVFPEFDRRRHRGEAPAQLQRIYRSIDWGHGVFVCLWIGEDQENIAWVLDTYRAEEGTLPQHAEAIHAHPIQQVEATFCDPAGRSRSDQTGLSNVQIFNRCGISCRYTLQPRLRSVQTGLEMIRAALQPARGSPRLFYVPTEANRRCFVRAMESYRNRRINGVWTDLPQDPQPHEHVPDALRYYFVNRNANRSVAMVGYAAR